MKALEIYFKLIELVELMKEQGKKKEESFKPIPELANSSDIIYVELSREQHNKIKRFAKITGMPIKNARCLVIEFGLEPALEYALKIQRDAKIHFEE